MLLKALIVAATISSVESVSRLHRAVQTTEVHTEIMEHAFDSKAGPAVMDNGDKVHFLYPAMEGAPPALGEATISSKKPALMAATKVLTQQTVTVKAKAKAVMAKASAKAATLGPVASVSVTKHAKVVEPAKVEAPLQPARILVAPKIEALAQKKVVAAAKKAVKKDDPAAAAAGDDDKPKDPIPDPQQEAKQDEVKQEAAQEQEAKHYEPEKEAKGPAVLPLAVQDSGAAATAASVALLALPAALALL